MWPVFLKPAPASMGCGCTCWFVWVAPVPTAIVGAQKCVLSECVFLKYGEASPTGCSNSVGKKLADVINLKQGL